MLNLPYIGLCEPYQPAETFQSNTDIAGQFKCSFQISYFVETHCSELKSSAHEQQKHRFAMYYLNLEKTY